MALSEGAENTWSVYPISAEGLQGECLAHPDGYVFMPEDEALALATEYAGKHGLQVVRSYRSQVNKAATILAEVMQQRDVAEIRVKELEALEPIRAILQRSEYRGLWKSRTINPDGSYDLGWSVTFVLHGDYCEVPYQPTANEAARRALAILEADDLARVAGAFDAGTQTSKVGRT